MTLKILILGGTTFLGPYLVKELEERGHRFTLFNRGTQNIDFGKEIEILYGDRQGGLHLLKNRHWDAIIDTSVTSLSGKIL